MIYDARFQALRDRLGALHGKSHALARQLGDCRLAHNGNESQIAGPTQFAEIEVAQLARQRMASSMQLAEPGAQSLEASLIGHRFPP